MIRSWYILPVELERKTVRSEIFVPNPDPIMFSTPLAAGLAELGVSDEIIGAVAEPLV